MGVSTNCIPRVSNIIGIAAFPMVCRGRNIGSGTRNPVNSIRTAAIAAYTTGILKTAFSASLGFRLALEAKYTARVFKRKPCAINSITARWKPSCPKAKRQIANPKFPAFPNTVVRASAFR